MATKILIIDGQHKLMREVMMAVAKNHAALDIEVIDSNDIAALRKHKEFLQPIWNDFTLPVEKNYSTTRNYPTRHTLKNNQSLNLRRT